ncbi:acyl-CoA dehydrogenase family protein [Mycobacterium sp. 050272]|uniref:acyl-CoA dehydrogenase family protein n=1 Tax=Mycobacterium sp. 050272 TaxID=3142488 RepID=UPI00318BBD5B
MADVIEATERDLMAQTLRRFAAEFDGAHLSKALADFGFAELLAEAPREAVSTLFDALGRAGSTSTSLQDVLLQPLNRVLERATGAHCVVLPRIGADLSGSFDGDVVTLRGLVIGQRPATVFLAPVATRGSIAWVSVADPSALTTRVVAGLDPALAMTEVDAAGVAATVVSAGEQANALWNAVASAGRRALGYQIVGAVGAMIGLAVEHARNRVQFGRPIGSFQGVRNRLAEAYVAYTAAAAALELAWEADDEYLAGMLAKSLAGRSARVAGTHCQQVLAGIGFTAEHPYHHYLARALVLDSVLGSTVELRRAIGQQLVSAGDIPRLVEL